MVECADSGWGRCLGLPPKHILKHLILDVRQPLHSADGGALSDDIVRAGEALPAPPNGQRSYSARVKLLASLGNRVQRRQQAWRSCSHHEHSHSPFVPRPVCSRFPCSVASQWRNTHPSLSVMLCFITGLIQYLLLTTSTRSLDIA